MHHSLPTLATHLPTAAWGGAPIDAGIHALLGAAPLASVSLVGDLEAHPSSGSGPWPRFVTELGEADGTAMLDIGRLYTELVLLARGIAAENPGSAAQEILTLAPATAGDLSALPAHPGLSTFVTSRGGGLLVRDPDSRMTAVVAIPPARTDLSWTVKIVPDVPMAPQAPSLSHATAELTDAVHGAAEVIAASSGAFTAGTSATPTMPETAVVDFPTALGGRAAQLFERADTIEGIRLMANAAESRRGAPADQQPTLWRLQSAVNLARRAAVAQFAAEQLELLRAHSRGATGEADSGAHPGPNTQTRTN